MNEQEKLKDEDIIDRMLSCDTIDEWNNAREFTKEFRGQTWISTNIDMGLIGQVDLKTVMVVPRTNNTEERPGVVIDPSIALSNGSNTLRDWYRQQKHQC